jgi:hypothetical protein
MATVRGESTPAGARARGRPLTQALNRMGRRKPDGAKETRFEILAGRLWQMALVEGDRAAIRTIMEYCEGKPTAALAATLAAGGRLSITADDLARAARELADWETEIEAGDLEAPGTKDT